MLDIQKITKKIEQAYKQTALQFGEVMQKVISEPGVFPDYSGDMVDTGAFKASQIVQFPTPLLAEYIWAVDYALALHEGVTYRNGTRRQGRPWTTQALAEFNWEARFAENLGRLL